jgi:hypothetical protein
MSDDLLARVKAARVTWAELDDPPRRAVQFTRPGLDEQYRLLELRGPERIRGYLGLISDWTGFCEADALPDGRAEVAIPFSADLLLALCEDDGDLLARVLEALQTRRQQLRQQEEAAQGN